MVATSYTAGRAAARGMTLQNCREFLHESHRSESPGAQPGPRNCCRRAPPESRRRGPQRSPPAPRRCGRDHRQCRLLHIPEGAERAHGCPRPCQRVPHRDSSSRRLRALRGSAPGDRFLQLRHAHGAPGALEKLLRGRGPVLLRARKLAKAELENARHPRRATRDSMPAIQL